MELTREFILSLKYNNISNPFSEPIEFVKVNKKYNICTEVIVPSENAWSSKKLATDEESEIVKTIKGVMNKISVSNFEVLSYQLYTLEIKTERCVKELIDIIFNKSVYEQNFSNIYANLCYKLSKRDFQTENDIFNFRNELINQCQKVFESKDEEKPLMLGNINFIGELYNKELIPESIIFNCINIFFDNIEKLKDIENNIECLCKLITTIGKKLDYHKNIEMLKICFDNFETLSIDKSIKPRYRFMMKDVIDLRKNKWINRRSNKIMLQK